MTGPVTDLTISSLDIYTVYIHYINAFMNSGSKHWCSFQKICNNYCKWPVSPYTCMIHKPLISCKNNFLCDSTWHLNVRLQGQWTARKCYTTTIIWNLSVSDLSETIKLIKFNILSFQCLFPIMPCNHLHHSSYYWCLKQKCTLTLGFHTRSLCRWHSSPLSAGLTLLFCHVIFTFVCLWWS